VTPFPPLFLFFSQIEFGSSVATFSKIFGKVGPCEELSLIAGVCPAHICLGRAPEGAETWNDPRDFQRKVIERPPPFL